MNGGPEIPGVEHRMCWVHPEATGQGHSSLAAGRAEQSFREPQLTPVTAPWDRHPGLQNFSSTWEAEG